MDDREGAKALVELALHSRAESTMRKYINAYTRWKQWASQKLGRYSLPANQFFLCQYLQHLVSKGSRSAVEEAVHAVSWVHQIAGLQNPSDHPTVHAVMDGARRLLAAPKQRI